MGRKCCVPGCRSNYNKSPYTPSFTFPKNDEKRNLWIRSINRADFEPSATAVVCVNHFEEKFIIREDRMKRDDGTMLIVRRTKLALTEDAYPTRFPNQPSYLTENNIAMAPSKSTTLPELQQGGVSERNTSRIMMTYVIAVQEIIKQEPQDEMSNYNMSATGEEVACMPTRSMVITPSSSLLDDQGEFIQGHTKTEGELPRSRTLMDAVFVKQEIEDAEEGEDYSMVDQMEVAEDEDTRGEETGDGKIDAFSDAAIIVKSEKETDIDQEEKHSSKETGHTCSVCGKVFDKSQACLRHMWQNHTGEKPYTCHICGKAFKHLQNFSCHKITHSNDRPYSCDLCGKTFKRKNAVQIHKRQCHSDERNYSCNLCGKTFKPKNAVQKHKVACHSNAGPYSCDLCDKTFKRKGDIHQHKAACHSNGRPFSCDLCKKTFYRKTSLQRHKATYHSFERPFSCDLCEKTYKRKTVLQRHKAAYH